MRGLRSGARRVVGGSVLRGMWERSHFMWWYAPDFGCEIMAVIVFSAMHFSPLVYFALHSLSSYTNTVSWMRDRIDEK